jgi:hypothetical protein
MDSKLFSRFAPLLRHMTDAELLAEIDGRSGCCWVLAWPAASASRLPTRRSTT